MLYFMESLEYFLKFLLVLRPASQQDPEDGLARAEIFGVEVDEVELSVSALPAWPPHWAWS